MKERMATRKGEPKHALVIMIVPHGKPPKGKSLPAVKRAPKKGRK